MCLKSAIHKMDVARVNNEIKPLIARVRALYPYIFNILNSPIDIQMNIDKPTVIINLNQYLSINNIDNLEDVCHEKYLSMDIKSNPIAIQTGVINPSIKAKNVRELRILICIHPNKNIGI